VLEAPPSATSAISKEAMGIMGVWHWFIDVLVNPAGNAAQRFSDKS